MAEYQRYRQKQKPKSLLPVSQCSIENDQRNAWHQMQIYDSKSGPSKKARNPLAGLCPNVDSSAHSKKIRHPLADLCSNVESSAYRAKKKRKGADNQQIKVKNELSSVLSPVCKDCKAEYKDGLKDTCFLYEAACHGAGSLDLIDSSPPKSRHGSMPAAQISTSPEIMKTKSEFRKGTGCFGAGAMVGEKRVRDRRKCKPRGLLTVGFSKDGHNADYFCGLPVPGSASLEWVSDDITCFGSSSETGSSMWNSSKDQPDLIWRDGLEQQWKQMDWTNSLAADLKKSRDWGGFEMDSSDFSLLSISDRSSSASVHSKIGDYSFEMQKSASSNTLHADYFVSSELQNQKTGKGDQANQTSKGAHSSISSRYDSCVSYEFQYQEHELEKAGSHFAGVKTEQLNTVNLSRAAANRYADCESESELTEDSSSFSETRDIHEVEFYKSEKSKADSTNLLTNHLRKLRIAQKDECTIESKKMKPSEENYGGSDLQKVIFGERECSREPQSGLICEEAQELDVPKTGCAAAAKEEIKRADSEPASVQFANRFLAGSCKVAFGAGCFMAGVALANYMYNKRLCRR